MSGGSTIDRQTGGHPLRETRRSTREPERCHCPHASIRSAPHSPRAASRRPSFHTRRRSRHSAASRHPSRIGPSRTRSSPFPALLCLGNDAAVLVVRRLPYRQTSVPTTQVVTYRSYDFRRAPDPPGELRTTLLAALDEAGIDPGPTGVEARTPAARDRRVAEGGRAAPGRVRHRRRRVTARRPHRPIWSRSARRAGSRTSSSRRSRTTPHRVSAKPSWRDWPPRRCFGRPDGACRRSSP